MGDSRPRQLLLQFQLDDAANFENFYPGERNQSLFLQLRGDAVAEVAAIFLWGRSGAGKSHLLQASCHRCAEAGGRPIFLPLSRVGELEPAVLEGLESLDLVGLDGLEQIIGDPAWEQALFGLYNRAQETGTRLLFSALSPPASLRFGLPDLQSRLQSAMIFQVHDLGDTEKADLLRYRARRLGIDLSGVVVDYILQRHDRSTRALVEVLRTLDRQSLEQKRRVTVPLVRQVMGW